MAPRKPNPASVKGPDPGRVDDDSTAFLGVSLVDDVELAKLVELPQLSPSALVRIAIFDWACRTSGFEPNTELSGAIFFATVNSKTVITPAGTKKTVFGSVNFNVRPERSDLWPVNAAMSKWDRHWMARWFYHTIPFEAGSESAKALRCRRRAIAPNRRPKMAVDGAMDARFILLRKSWQVAVDQGEEVDGLPNLILPEGVNMLTLDQAETEARRMIGDVSVVEYSQLLTRQSAGWANRVYKGELPPRANPHKADDDAGPSRKRMRGQDDAEERNGEDEGEEEEEAVADKAVNEAVEDRVDTPGYTPTPSPGHNETGVESNSSPLRRLDLEGAKALVSRPKSTLKYILEIVQRIIKIHVKASNN
uniref:Uncharacterized protein n=2 Tax=Oryza sativa subsp. japonica TaxID=39947 RepID=A0A5S6RD99_ORYSJ|nr:Hypothetical protein [Oryza sativa Japonica Group]AAP52843.1 hypothetical protein LOC_Os10g16490 [Oryza sativa Japonica Group]